MLLDGKMLALSQHKAFQRQVVALKKKGITPGLAIVMVGEHSASHVYVRNKRVLCEKLGIKFQLKELKSTVSEATVVCEIQKLNRDKKIHGVILQLPVPKKFNALRLILSIDPMKDVDGLHPMNLGLLASGKPLFIPATPKGILELLDYYQIKLKGKNVVVVGFGQVVGMPMSLLLAQRQATVTIAHDATKKLKDFTNQADILITAAGSPGLIKADMIKRGVVIVDAGISKLGTKFTGDVEFNSVFKKAKYITPVPGGVGPMTVSALISNVIQSARNS